MKIIAHRCGTDKFPKLTIDSAKHSLKYGAYLVEMDVHFTSDKYVTILIVTFYLVTIEKSGT